MNLSPRKYLQFTGRRAGLWLGLSSVAGLALTLLEIGVSIALGLLLAVLQITPEGTALPFGVDEWLLDGGEVSPALLGGALLVIAVLRGLAQWTVSQAGSYSQEMITTRLRFLTLHEILATRKGFASLSQLHSRFGEIFPRAASFCNQVSYFIPLAIQSVVLGAVLLWRFPREAVYGALGMVVVGILVHGIARRIRSVAETLPAEHLSLQSRIGRVVRNWFLVQALRTNRTEWAGIAAHQSDYSLRQVRTSGLSHFSNILPLVLGTGLIVVLIQLHLHQPGGSGVEFIAFLYLYMRLVQGLASLAGVLGNVQATLPFYREARGFFFSFTPEFRSEALEPLRYGFSDRGTPIPALEEPRDVSAPPIEPPPPAISVEGLRFSYAGAVAPVISGLSFSVPPGGQVAILGKSGSGKSTLLALTMGLLTPSSGQVRIDGLDPESYFRAHPGSLGYVGAEPFLIEGSIRENLLYGLSPVVAQTLTDSDLRSELERVRLGEWLAQQPAGLDYRLSENGEGLSMGQKQRLTLARALLGRPSLLILDEVSANLDDATESEIAKLISSLEGRVTTLIVTHREGMVRHVQTRKSL